MLRPYTRIEFLIAGAIYVTGTGLTGFYGSIDGLPQSAPVIRSHQVAATPPCPPHASSCADEPAGAPLTLRDRLGPAAAYPEQGCPAGSPFGKGGGEIFPEHSRHCVGVRVAEEAGVESPLRGQIRVLHEGAAFAAGSVSPRPLQRRHGAEGIVELTEAAIGGVAVKQAQVLVRVGGCEEVGLPCPSPRDEGAGDDGTDPQACRKLEERGKLLQIVPHLGKGDRDPPAKPCTGKSPYSRHRLVEGAIPAHQVMARRFCPIEADLNRKPREVEFPQLSHLFVGEEHGVCLQSNAAKPDGAGEPDEIQPVRMTERFAAGEA